MNAVSKAPQGGQSDVTAVISSSSVIRPPAPSRCYNGCSPIAHRARGREGIPARGSDAGTPPTPTVAKDTLFEPKLYDTSTGLVVSTGFVASTGFVTSFGFVGSIVCV